MAFKLHNTLSANIVIILATNIKHPERTAAQEVDDSSIHARLLELWNICLRQFHEPYLFEDAAAEKRIAVMDKVTPEWRDKLETYIDVVSFKRRVHQYSLVRLEAIHTTDFKQPIDIPLRLNADGCRLYLAMRDVWVMNAVANDNRFIDEYISDLHGKYDKIWRHLGRDLLGKALEYNLRYLQNCDFSIDEHSELVEQESLAITISEQLEEMKMAELKKKKKATPKKKSPAALKKLLHIQVRNHKINALKKRFEDIRDETPGKDNDDLLWFNMVKESDLEDVAVELQSFLDEPDLDSFLEFAKKKRKLIMNSGYRDENGRFYSEAFEL